MNCQQNLFDNNYSVGDEVMVSLPGSLQQGKIVAISRNYAWSDEIKYEVRGKELVTITSARNIKRSP